MAITKSKIRKLMFLLNVSYVRWLKKTKTVKNIFQAFVFLAFTSIFSLQYQYNVKQTGDENIENHQLVDIVLIYNQIL